MDPNTFLATIIFFGLITIGSCLDVTVAANSTKVDNNKKELRGELQAENRDGGDSTYGGGGGYYSPPNYAANSYNPYASLPLFLPHHKPAPAAPAAVALAEGDFVGSGPAAAPVAAPSISYGLHTAALLAALPMYGHAGTGYMGNSGSGEWDGD